MRVKPASCAGCACEKHGNDFSHIEGAGSSRVMYVGEGSGEHEQRDELPFRPYAPAGSLLERVLRRMGIDRQQLSITNVVRCRPRNNWLEGAPWEFSAINHCRPNLTEAISSRGPKCIVALGGTALRELTGMAGDAQGISHLAGYVLPGPENVPVIGNFHPAFLRRGKASYQGVFARILQRAMNIAAGRDREWMWGVVPEDRSTHGSIRYQVHPSLDEAGAFAERVISNGGLTLSYDIETGESVSLDEDAREGFADTHIRLIQFSVGGATGIALPWEGAYKSLAQRLLQSSNVKCGHNVWLFDNKVLRANGVEVAGTIHDTLQMFHHWQPDLPAHLQFCAQFVQFPFPWKHLAGTDLAFYGCCDVDATLRLYNMLQATLQRDGLWGDDTTGYVGQIYNVRPILAAMEDRGLPIDDAARLRLDAEFAIAQRDLGTEIAALAPAECKRVHPKQGYKGVPPEVKAWLAMHQVPDLPGHHTEFMEVPVIFTESGDDGESYCYDRRDFPVPVMDEASGDIAITLATRWCRVYDFNPNSSQQLLSYMKVKKHPVPKGKEEDADGKQKDTTAKKELQRLAKKTGDTFYLKVIEYRELGKMRGTYIDGFAPSPDGCVHTTFTFDTGIGQLSSRNPNIQNIPKHGRLAKAIRRMVRAKPGNVLTEWDFKSCHVLTLGFLSEDANYIRCARIDMHSLMTGHYLKLWDINCILSESDDELRARCKWLKSNPEYKHIRDAKVKHAGLGIGNGLRAKGLYERHMEFFSSQKEAAAILADYERVFPKVFAWQKRVQKLAHEQQYLKTEYGHIRRFYEVFRWDSRKGDWGHGDQAEEAISFWLSNIAFGHIRESMKELARRGLDEKYGMVDNIHDALEFHFPAHMLDEHAAEIYPVLSAPSKVLRHPTIAPDGLVIDVDACYGDTWAEMHELEIIRSHNEQAAQAVL